MRDGFANCHQHEATVSVLVPLLAPSALGTRLEYQLEYELDHLPSSKPGTQHFHLCTYLPLEVPWLILPASPYCNNPSLGRSLEDLASLHD